MICHTKQSDNHDEGTAATDVIAAVRIIIATALTL